MFFLILHELIYLSEFLWLMSIIGLLQSLNFFNFLIQIEFVLLSISFFVLTVSIVSGQILGYVAILVILVTSITEATIGLGLLVLLYKTNSDISFNNFSTLK